MTVKVIVPIHISKGGGFSLFQEFLRRHLPFTLTIDFILVNQEEEYSNKIANEVTSNSFECTLIDNFTSNKSVAVGRNIGLSICNIGDWVSFLDFDDFLEPEWLLFSQNLNIFEKLFAPDVCIFNYRIRNKGFDTIYIPPILKRGSYLTHHIYNNYTPCLGTMFKFRQRVWFTETTDDINEDLLFWNNILRLSDLQKIKHFNFVSGVYRPRDNGRSSLQKFDLKVYHNTLKDFDINPILRLYFFVMKFVFGVKKYYLRIVLKKFLK